MSGDRQGGGRGRGGEIKEEERSEFQERKGIIKREANVNRSRQMWRTVRTGRSVPGQLADLSGCLLYGRAFLLVALSCLSVQARPCQALLSRFPLSLSCFLALSSPRPHTDLSSLELHSGSIDITAPASYVLP